MSLVSKVTDLAFCQKVAFAAMRAAQKVATESPDTPNHVVRAAYADRVFRGEDKAALLAAHVAVANTNVAAALEAGEEVQDSDIAMALDSIWDARAAAFGSADVYLTKMV